MATIEERIAALEAKLKQEKAKKKASRQSHGEIGIVHLDFSLRCFSKKAS